MLGAGGHVGSYNKTAIYGDIYQICENLPTILCLGLTALTATTPLPPLKSVYKLMPSSSPNFLGCEDYLQKLDECFHVQAANERGHRVFVLFGNGGIGKTQICLKFAENSSNR
jgi:hypothetical protein